MVLPPISGRGFGHSELYLTDKTSSSQKNEQVHSLFVSSLYENLSDFNKKSRLESKDFEFYAQLAGDEGFEPPITGPEPGALPLGQSPIHTQLYHNPPQKLTFGVLLRQPASPYNPNSPSFSA